MIPQPWNPKATVAFGIRTGQIIPAQPVDVKALLSAKRMEQRAKLKAAKLAATVKFHRVVPESNFISFPSALLKNGGVTRMSAGRREDSKNER